MVVERGFIGFCDFEDLDFISGFGFERH